MSKAKWVNWGKAGGPLIRGSVRFKPIKYSDRPYGPWTKIIGTVARCEGNHDTVVMYDKTGVTWGFLQWTFTSGRLQKLLSRLKTVAYYDFTQEEENFNDNLFDNIGVNRYLSEYGLEIREDKFFDLEWGAPLDPRKNRDKNRIVDVCMGAAFYGSEKKQREHAMGLAKVFGYFGSVPAVRDVQVSFAKEEFQRHLDYRRSVLGDVGIIRDLLYNEIDSPIAGLFFNLWQNSPGMSYRLFRNAKKQHERGDGKYFDLVWKKVNRSKYGSWGWRSRRYMQDHRRKPRVYRIKKALEEFYGVELRFYK